MRGTTYAALRAYCASAGVSMSDFTETALAARFIAHGLEPPTGQLPAVVAGAARDRDIEAMERQLLYLDVAMDACPIEDLAWDDLAQEHRLLVKRYAQAREPGPTGGAATGGGKEAKLEPAESASVPAPAQIRRSLIQQAASAKLAPVHAAPRVLRPEPPKPPVPTTPLPSMRPTAVGPKRAMGSQPW